MNENKMSSKLDLITVPWIEIQLFLELYQFIDPFSYNIDKKFSDVIRHYREI